MASGLPPSLSQKRFYTTIVLPLLLCALLVSVLVWRILTPQARTEAAPEPDLDPAAGVHPSAVIMPPSEQGVERLAQKSVGLVILERYANPSQTPEADLKDMAHALENYALLVKGENPLPLGSNQEIATAFRGGNAMNLMFLNPDHQAFGLDGQLVDRWGSPLFFHVESRDQIDIRSAGPDKVMWNANDIQRHYDGSYLTGEALNPPSLHQEKKRR